MTPLEISLQQNNYCMHVELLISSGKYKRGIVAFAISKSECLLHHAVFLNRTALIEALLKYKEIRINEIDSNGDTPLHIASCLDYD